MKNLLPNIRSRTGATLGLLIASVIGGIGGAAAKILVTEMPPITAVFWRVTFMLLILIPVSWKRLPLLWVHRRKLFILGLLWVTNISLFILGIRNTTVFVSQVLYAFVPAEILFFMILMKKDAFTPEKAIGLIVGSLGVVFFFIRSGNPIAGTFSGTAMIYAATVSWAGYLLYSRRVSHSVSPLGMLTASAIIAWCVSLILSSVVEGIPTFSQLFDLSFVGWVALVFLASMAGVFMVFLYVWGTTYGSPFAAASVMYLSVLVGGVTGFMLFGEKMTGNHVIGAILLLAGVFFSVTIPLLKSLDHKKVTEG